MNNEQSIPILGILPICKMAGINAGSEVSVAGGDIDLLIESDHYVCVMEFITDKRPEEALKLIESHGYALPWVADRRKVFKIGIEYSSEKGNIIDWKIDPES